MFRWFSALVFTATLATAALLPGWSAAQTMQGYGASKDVPAKTGTSATPAAQEYGGIQAYGDAPWAGAGIIPSPGGERVRCPCRGGYCYRKPHWFFDRRTYGYPYYGPSHPIAAQYFPTGCFPIIGIVYSGCGYGGAGSCAHAPLAGGPQSAGSPGGTTPSGAPANLPDVPPAKKTSLPKNAARLQLVVPENAEVLIDDHKTTRTGAVRQFVSPPLDPEKSFTYQITIRYRDANGTTLDGKHSIRVRANDQLRMDFTSPPSQQKVASGER
jgi:uncharacterized protein (TIGR03000 family)